MEKDETEKGGIKYKSLCQNVEFWHNDFIISG